MQGTHVAFIPYPSIVPSMRKLLGLNPKKEQPSVPSPTAPEIDPQGAAPSSGSSWLPLPRDHSTASLGNQTPATGGQPEVNLGAGPSRSGISAPVKVVNEGNVINIGSSAKVDMQTGHRFNIHYGDKISYHSQTEKSASDLAIEKIPHSNYAEYDVIESVTRGPCAPGTRTDVLDTLNEWTKSGRARLYWLSGVAGCGKTTISYSYCLLMQEKKRLGASFFCSRSLEECRNTKLIIPTIAHQLSHIFPRYKEALVEILRTNPNIFKKSLDAQLRGLIIEPWSAEKWRLPSDIVVVIDALDECDGGQSTFLDTLFGHTTKLPFRFLLTSRPDYSIRDTMREKDPSILSTFVLHEVEGGLVQEDITKYLRYQLSGRVPRDVIDALRELSGSLFIVAATLARFFTGGNIDASARLEMLRTSLPTKRSVLGPLDEFYRGILASALHEGELLGVEIEGIKEVLFTVVCARNPMSLECLAEILDVSEEETSRRLDSLQSILFIPQSRNLPIMVLHASLPDFIQDLSRSGDFHCHPDLFHLKTLKRSLAILNKRLPQDHVEVASAFPSYPANPSMVTSQIGPALRYTVVYWVEHLHLVSDGQSRNKAFDKINDFLGAHGLHWIECLSHLSRLSVAVQSLENLQSIIEEESPLAAVTYEYLRMVQYYYGFIEDNPTAIYQLIPFVPLHSPLHGLHARHFSSMPRVQCGPHNWPALERVINVHSDTVWSIAISQDGNRMASGSDDKTVRIWNIRTHTEECVLTGHTKKVNSVAITRDGGRIISGSDDETARVWDVATNRVVFPLMASGSVMAVAISSDEKYLASGDSNHHIQIWDAKIGRRLCTLEGHTHWIRCLSFLPNTTHLVSGSDDRTARLWNALTGETQSTLRGHTGTVRSVAWSPAGDKIVTGSTDYSARIWNTSGQQLQVLKGHSFDVNAVAFMPDGKRVVTGSYDRTLRVWDAGTGDILHVFTTTGSVRSVAIFPDGQKIASSSRSQIEIWSMRSVNSQVTAHATARVTMINAESMVFSSDGQRALLLPSLQILDTMTLEERVILHSVNSGHNRGAWSSTRRRVAISTEKVYSIEVWELSGDDDIMGNPLILRGHRNRIYHISFSPDERHLCSASSDKTVRLWDATAGEQLRVLRHPYEVHGASFSHDNTQLVADCSITVHIWDACTGQQLRQINKGVHSVIFSPDDQHLITYDHNTITFLNTQTCKPESVHPGLISWTTFVNGVSYALTMDGWVCRFANLHDGPDKLLRIPPQHLPNTPWELDNALFYQTPHGVQLCLPRKDALMTLTIPPGYQHRSSPFLPTPYR